MHLFAPERMRSPFMHNHFFSCGSIVSSHNSTAWSRLARSRPADPDVPSNGLPFFKLLVLSDSLFVLAFCLRIAARHAIDVEHHNALYQAGADTLRASRKSVSPFE
eukprot:1372120-Pleurochrysis_carterae.AAC.3